MPNYDFQCSICEFVVKDIQLPVAERDDPVGAPCFTSLLPRGDDDDFEDPPTCTGQMERIIAAPGIGYLMGGIKTPQGFKDVLRNIKKNHLHSTINV